MNLNIYNPYLTAYWSLDETSGNRTDYIFGHALAQNGVVSYRPGMWYNGSFFIGDNYLYTPHNIHYGSVNGFMISMWVMFEREYNDSSSSSYLSSSYSFDDYNANNSNIINKGVYYDIFTQSMPLSHKWKATINNNAIVFNGSSWTDAKSDQWYHILLGAANGIAVFCIQYKDANGNLIRFYDDTTYVGTLTINANNLIVGETMKGRIDELAIWQAPNVTSVDEFLEIENSIFNSGRGLFYNPEEDLWEYPVTVNALTTYVPTDITPNTTRTLSLEHVQTYVYESGVKRYRPDASDRRATIETINTGSFSFGTLAPGETSQNMIVRLNVAEAVVIRNIKIGLVDTGGIPFTTTTFGVEVRSSKDYNIVPDSFFQGISTGVDSVFNIDVDNSTKTSSYYVYLNVKVPAGTSYDGDMIRYIWYFDFA